MHASLVFFFFGVSSKKKKVDLTKEGINRDLYREFWKRKKKKKKEGGKKRFV